MKNNKTIDLLKQFSNQELDKFRLFLESPYHNTDEALIQLFSGLVSFLLDEHNNHSLTELVAQLKNKPLSKGELSKKDRTYLNAKMSLLYHLALQFLCLETFDEEHPTYKALVIESLLAKRQMTASASFLKKEQKKLRQQSYQHIRNHRTAFELEKGRLNYLLQNRLIEKKNNITEVLQQLDTYYLLTRQNYENLALSLSRVSNNAHFEEELLDLASPLKRKSPYAEHQLIQVNNIIADLMKTNEETYYFELIRFLDEETLVLSPKQLQEFYKAALNFCMHQAFRGKLEFLQYLFELYQTLDEKNLLLEKGRMSIARLKNIVSVCCKVGDFEWGSAAVEKYKPLLNHPDPDSVVHVNLGAIAFYQHDYKQAIYHLIRVDKVSTGYDLDCRIMLLKSYYELDEDYDERTMTMFRTVAMFIRNHTQLSSKRKKAFKNFVRITINLYRYKHRATKMQLDSIRSKIESLEFFSDKKWLLDKINHLK